MQYKDIKLNLSYISKCVDIRIVLAMAQIVAAQLDK